MKIRTVFLNLFLILLFFGCNQDKKNVIQFLEAESGKYISMQEMHDKDASGGRYLQMKDAGDVKWDVSVPEKAYYKVEMQYRSPSGDKEQMLQINDKIIPVGFGISNQWKLWSQDFRLDSGKNTIVLKKDWGEMDIDFIAIKPAELLYDITPLNLTFYKNHPRDLVIKIDNYHQPVQKISIDSVAVSFSIKPYPYQEYAVWAEIGNAALTGFANGRHNFTVDIVTTKLVGNILIDNTPAPSDLIIVAPDVSHGSSVILKMPGNKNMMIDCGQGWVRDSVLIPLLERHHIDTIHTFIITHYHDDHMGGDSGRTILERFHVEKFFDYRTYPSGFSWVENGVSFKVLNSYPDGNDENTRSLALKISYKDFVYIHSGDIYGINQQRIREQFPDDIRAHVYYANHHFHGSLDTGYLRAVNPDLVIVQAQEAIYARYAYMVNYKKETVDYLNRHRPVKVETMPVIETGMVVLRINNADEWWYETYKDQDFAVIPGF
ncbi:MAG: MBL fold metallo-hydrolase [Bacteroidales bacterium]|nr:MBL fold metallo-hydrolase [Bacteroidales bacterium]